MSSLLQNLPRAARELHIDAKWLRQEAEAGRLPGLRAGRTWLFRVDVLRDLLADRAARTETEVPHGT